MKLVLLLFFISPSLWAYIPPTRMILQRLSENSGTGRYEIIKEVRFSNPEAPTVKETWKIENERTFKVTIEVLNSNPVQKMQYLYAGGQRYIQNGTKREVSKMPVEQAERVFHFRSVENLAAYLTNLQVLTSAIGNLDLSRLNRAQGVVNYGLGKKTDPDSDRKLPYLWIEQDRFVIRKLRFESDVEVTADSFQTQPKGLYHPEEINIKWKEKSARVKTLSVSLKKWPADTFQLQSLENSQSFLQRLNPDETSTEFYSRFR